MTVGNAYGSTATGGGGMVLGGPDPTQADMMQRTFQGQQAGLDRANQMKLLQAGQAPQLQSLALQSAHWNAMFPYLQKALGGLSGGFNASVGGKSGKGPRISGGPVFDQQAVQQNVNQMRATGAQQTAGQVQGMQDRLAGSGFGARSPLAAALATQMGMANQASTAGQVRDFKNTAATANANQTLKSQTAQEGQYSNRMQEDIARRRNVIGQQQGLLGLLGQLM